MKSVLITLSDSINSSSLPPPVKPPTPVKAEPSAAGKIAGKVASGSVPVKLAAGKEVKFAPLPVKDVAVTPPLTL